MNFQTRLDVLLLIDLVKKAVLIPKAHSFHLLVEEGEVVLQDHLWMMSAEVTAKSQLTSAAAAQGKGSAPPLKTKLTMAMMSAEVSAPFSSTSPVSAIAQLLGLDRSTR